ncbi:YSIRK-type signal peptide-containing protein [Limosilactobacillus sp. STM2_1]|uniref:YSIRK-type signal peptide-containing protein n=1 Tax=Limosilactobacillus rudii TaxID=2759755 RepID=A0A7W3UJ36_9LACO|nr:Rib/alpha-like domain-containing protein [Limosilactobacillus rudii]MBB1078357.1 YSIRK-type signal peptide-containing protein [Limosilactobacillus rudii]MBB1096487.1 YSIRK-type signal peptide-containing protein [Limosilactobacillus rudii]MCD7134317.1 YPDG domain-containing protein [Limosilactobacillus rudii]
MLSKNNRQEYFRKQEPKKQRFTIKKLTVGVASVLLGFTFMGINASASADEVQPDSDANAHSATSAQASNDANATSTTLKASAAADSSAVAPSAAPASQSATVADAFEKAVASNTAEAEKAAASSHGQSDAPAASSDVDTNAVLESVAAEKTTANANENTAFRAAQNNDQPGKQYDVIDGVATVDGIYGLSQAIANKDVNTINLSNNIDLTNLTDEEADVKGGAWTGGNKGDYHNTLLGAHELAFGNKNAFDKTFNGIARDLTIDGNGHELNMGQWFFSFWDKNYDNGAKWNLTVKNMDLKTNDTTSGYGPFHFFVNQKNADNTNLTFENVTADVKNASLVDNSGAGVGQINVTFAGNNKVTNVLPGTGYSTVVARNVDFAKDATLDMNVTGPVTSGKTTGKGYNAFYVGVENERDATLEKPAAQGNFTMGENAKLTFNKGIDRENGVGHNLRFLYDNNAQGGNVVLKSGSNMDLTMGTGHSIAIYAGNLQIDKDATLNIDTRQDNNKNGTVKDSATLTNDGFHYAPITLNVIEGDPHILQKNSNSLVDNGTLRIVRGEKGMDIQTVDPLISFGSGYTNERQTYNLTVGEGATLDLQDSANSAYDGTWPDSMNWIGPKGSANIAGLVSMFGTGATNNVTITNPQYVNFQRLGSQVGSAFRLEGLHNNVIVKADDVKGTPLAQWNGSNQTETPDEAWRIQELNTQVAGGNFFSNFLPAGAKAGDKGGQYFDISGYLKSKYWGTPFDKSAGTAVMAPFQGDYKYVNGSYIGDSMSGVHGVGLTQLTNDFNWWSPRRITLGENGKIVINDATNYEPETQAINKTTNDKVSDFTKKDLQNGIKDLKGSDNTVAQDHETILGPDSLIDWNNSSWGLDWSKTDFTEDGKLRKDPSATLTTAQQNVYNALKKIASVTPATNEDGTLKVKTSGTGDDFNGQVATIIYKDSTADHPSVDFVLVPVNVTEPQADNYTPSYPAVTVEQGRETTATPSFTDKDGKATTAPEGTKFVKGDNAPDWATVGEDGTVTLNPGTDVTTGDYTIPVTVTYPDGSQDQTSVKVTVTDHVNDSDKYKASYPDLNVERPESGQATQSVNPSFENAKNMPEGTVTGYEAGDFAAPKGVNVDVNKTTGEVTATVDSDADLGSLTVPVTVTYKDGSSTTVNVPVSVTGVDHGNNTYYGNQTMTSFEATEQNYHKTSYDYTPEAAKSGFDTITFYSEWKGKGNTADAYNKHVTYKLNADRTKFINTEDPSDSFDASLISYEWINNSDKSYHKGVKAPNTNVSNFADGSADTLYKVNGVVNSAEQTEEGLRGNSKWRYTYMVDKSISGKLGLGYNGSSNWSNVYFNFYGATAKDNLKAGVGETVPTEAKDLENYLNLGNLATGTFENGQLTGASWNKTPGQDGKFVKGANEGTVRLTFNNDPNNYLDIDVTIAAGSTTVNPTDPTDENQKDLFMNVHRDVYVDGTKSDELSQTLSYARTKEVDANGDTVSYGAWTFGKLENGKWIASTEKAVFAEEDAPAGKNADDVTYVQYGKNGKKTKSDKIKSEAVQSTADAHGYLTPQNGISVYVTHENGGTAYDPSNSEMNQDVTRTITVYKTDGTTETVKQNVHFVRGGEGQNAKDKNGNWVDWTVATKDGGTWKSTGAKAGSWDEYDVPQVEGYTSTVDGKDAKVVEGNDKVTPEAHNTNVTVAYDKTTQPTDPLIDPNNPGENSDMFAHPTRTIKVTDPVTGKITTSTQTVWFGRTKTVSTDPNAPVKYGEWQLGKVDGDKFIADDKAPSVWPAYTAQEKKGYTSVVEGNTAEVKVTPDTEGETVNVSYNANTPKGQNITVNKGETPDPATAISNTGDLPDGTKYEWKTPVDTTTPGEKPATVVVTYPGGKTTEVPVTVTVNPTDADKYTADGGNITVDKGYTLTDEDAEKAIVNHNDLPAGTKYTWKTPVDTSTTGDKTGVVIVTYPDGSVDEAPVMVHVIDDAAKYDPQGQDVTIKKGDPVPAAKDGIKNTGDLPSDTKYEWEVAPDPSKVGKQPVVITVTYPDGSQDKVPTTVIVTDNATTPDKTDAEKYTPESQVVNVDKGHKLPDASEGIKNKDEMPEGTTYTWKNDVDTNTPGDKPAVITVHYPDGSAEDVPTIVHVNPSQADENTPKGQNITVEKDAPVPDASTAITNKDDLPQGTKYTWEITPDTSKVGDQPATVVVTYPDGSKDTVPVVITVNKPAQPRQTDADKYNPQGGTITAELGDDLTNAAPEGITNKGDLPSGTKYTWTNGIPSTAKSGLTMHDVTVTYPDGSSEVVSVYVNVTSQADEYTPEPQVVTVDKGQTPNAEDGIKNKSDLPDGTKYTWKTPVDTTTPGDKSVTVVVTYPDGSKDEVPTVVHVKTDAESNEPEGQPVNTVKGNVPAADDGIKNLDKLPEGTKPNWTNPDQVKEDVNTVGKHDEQITVTYPDGSKDTITVTVNVQNPANPGGNDQDKDKYSPETQPITTPEGVLPDASEGIKNKGDMPDGTTYTWKDEGKVREDVKTPGTHTEIIVVNYPDGSNIEKQVEVTVPAPEGQGINTDQGQLPNPADAIKNKDQMPDGTKYTWKQEPDVTTPGDHTGIVEVTFPDGTTYEVTVNVHVNAVNDNVNADTDNGNGNTAAPQADNNTTVTNKVAAPASTGDKKQSAAPAKQLPQTGNEANNTASLVGLSLASVASLFGLGGLRKKKEADK